MSENVRTGLTDEATEMTSAGDDRSSQGLIDAGGILGDRGPNTGKKMNSNATSATESAGMITRLGHLSYSQGYICGLTAAQWTALRYFAKANQFSRTLSAFANYRATTLGTASQTVKNLVTQGLLTRTRSKSDGRSVRFDLTERGRVVHGQDPFADLARSIAELPQGLQVKLQAALERVTGRMAHKRQRPLFGACAHCRHLEECVHCEDNVADYFCRAVGKPIEASRLEEICIKYEPGAGVL